MRRGDEGCVRRGGCSGSRSGRSDRSARWIRSSSCTTLRAGPSQFLQVNLAPINPLALRVSRRGRGSRWRHRRLFSGGLEAVLSEDGIHFVSCQSARLSLCAAQLFALACEGGKGNKGRTRGGAASLRGRRAGRLRPSRARSASSDWAARARTESVSPVRSVARSLRIPLPPSPIARLFPGRLENPPPLQRPERKTR